MQERQELEHLARSSSGVAIQGLCYRGFIPSFLLFLALKYPETKWDGPTVL